MTRDVYVCCVLCNEKACICSVIKDLFLFCCGGFVCVL